MHALHCVFEKVRRSPALRPAALGSGCLALLLFMAPVSAATQASASAAGASARSSATTWMPIHQLRIESLGVEAELRAGVVDRARISRLATQLDALGERLARAVESA